MIYETPHPQLNEGNQQKDNVQPEETVVNYQTALAIEPDSAEAHYQLAEAYYAKGKLEEAISAYRGVIEQNSNHRLAYHRLGDALTKAGQLDEAVTSYCKAIELNPSFAWSHNNLADALKAQEKWEQAVVSYRRAIEFNPDFSWSYYNLGEVLSQQQRWEDAITAYRRAIELNPNFFWSYYNLGIALEQQQQWEQATAAYRRAVEFNPDFASYQKLGHSLAKQGNLEEAIACYRKAIELNPNDSKINCFLGVALGNQGNFDEAIIYYCRALELNPESMEFHSYLWTIISQRQSWSEAVMWYHQLLEKQPGSAVTYYYLGTAFFNQEKWEESAESCRKGIELNPGYFWSHWLLGAALTKLEKWEEVVAAYNGASKINPSFDLIYSYSGDALRNLSKWEAATVAYRRCIEINPNSIAVYERLGESLLQLERFDDAIACYQNILEIQLEQTEENSKLGILLLQKGLLDQVIACYEKSFNFTANPKLYYKLSLLLAQQGLLDEAATYFQKASEMPPSEMDYENIWKYLNQTKWVDGQDLYCSKEFKWETVETYFNQTSLYKIISMRYLSDPDKIHLKESGLSLFHLELIGQDDIALEEIYINSFDSSKPTHLSKKYPKNTLKEIGIDWEAEANFSRRQNFQQSLVETGYIYSVCPFSGEVLRSNQSFYIDGIIPIIVYRFVGREVFYLKCGHVHGGKMSIYFPHLELIVVLPSTTRDWGALADNDVLLFNRFKAWLVSNWQQVKSYLCNDQPKKVASVLGTIRNMGHDFWNLLTGIHYLYENKILHKVDKFLVGPFNHINIRDVFPEIPSDNIVNFGAPWEIFQYVLENNYVAVITTGFLLKEELANKMYCGAIKRCSPSFLQTVEKAKKHFPLLWFEIRSSNARVWVSQVEGIANIIKSLHSDFPNLGVVFAGWHRLEMDYPGADAVIAREESIREQITDIIPTDIEIYSTIGQPIYEGLVWVNAIDIHITPLGSGTLIPVNVANKIGVCYSNPNNLSNSLGLKLINWRENILPLRLISPNSVTYDVSAYTSGQSAVDWPFHCDWRAIYDELIKILERLNESS